jgi:PHP family Zn ribbon phosphoesterase
LEIAVDLHAHSVFAGGTQGLKVSPETRDSNRKKAVLHIEKTNETMPLKGIDLIGTGDCQFEVWTEILKDILEEDKPGIFFLQGFDQTRYILQTEIIFTAPIGKHSKVVHVVFLFPDFSSVETFRDLLAKWGVKHRKMARPFVKCNSSDQVSERIFSILNIDPWIEAIPAHIMTPQGVFGSNVRVNHLSEFFGSVASRLNIFETGLSADPEFLALIPELDNRVLVSSSDAHSGALHRMGREFTVLSTNKIDYQSIISALRKNHISETIEFPPEEGRFFLTGHRAGRKHPGLHGENEYCYFSPQNVPSNDICPICNKHLTIGVFQRCVEISQIQGTARELGKIIPKRKFVRMVPLVDILSHVLSVKTKTAKTIITKYREITSIVGPERSLWQCTQEEVKEKLIDQVDKRVLDAIQEVKEGNFTFSPYGYDGIYGNLIINQRGQFTDVNVINSSRPIQQTLKR